MSHTHHDILTLDSNWEPHAWINLEKAIQHEATDEVIEHLGDKIFVYHGGKNRFTGEQSVLETSSIIVVSGAPSARRYKDPALTNIALFQRDLHICAYCGNHYAPSELTRDHIWPQNPTHGPGGKDIWMNVVTACRDCNSLKGGSDRGKIAAVQSGKRGDRSRVAPIRCRPCFLMRLPSHSLVLAFEPSDQGFRALYPGFFRFAAHLFHYAAMRLL